jgi:hypothetical protein
MMVMASLNTSGEVLKIKGGVADISLFCTSFPLGCLYFFSAELFNPLKLYEVLPSL